MSSNNEPGRGVIPKIFFALAAGLVSLVILAKIVELKSASAVGVPIGMLLVIIFVVGRADKSKNYDAAMERPAPAPYNPFIFTKRWAAQLAVWMVGMLLVLKWNEISTGMTNRNHWSDSVEISVFLAGTAVIIAIAYFVYKRLFRAKAV